jgi:hypothetical protein
VCEHSQLNVVYAENENGTVQLEFCTKCAKPVSVICEHRKNTWNKEETKLTCNFCGADGT